MGFKRETRIYAQPEGTYIMHVLKTWGWSSAPLSLAVPLFYWRIIKQPKLCNLSQQQPFPCSWSNCVRDIWTIKINLFCCMRYCLGQHVQQNSAGFLFVVTGKVKTWVGLFLQASMEAQVSKSESRNCLNCLEIASKTTQHRFEENKSLHKSKFKGRESISN